jgi:hypothetical protein
MAKVQAVAGVVEVNTRLFSWRVGDQVTSAPGVA